jgi:hypothetical protein
MDQARRRRLRAASDPGGRSRRPVPARPAAQLSTTSARNSVTELLRLQRTIGNAATGHLIAQLLGTKLDEPLPPGAETPVTETPGVQRKYTPEQYIKMWEQEQGRTLNSAEKDTIARGCIGLTALNLGAVNPPLDNAFDSFDLAHRDMVARNNTLEWMRRHLPGVPPARYVVFAKLFWSNQNPDEARRATSDPAAFQPDPRSHKVDMSGYHYRARPGFVNFDYGFWDEASQSFWHANHMDYHDPNDPMFVLQSTKDKFAHLLMEAGERRYGYRDFDRVIYCVALAENYDAGLAATAAAGRPPSP